MLTLNLMFHEDDSMLVWVKEKEGTALDDRDNPWIDEALIIKPPSRDKITNTSCMVLQNFDVYHLVLI